MDKPNELQELNEMTKEAGLEFVNIDGDAVNAVLVCAHKEVMAECDIIYGHHDGGFLTLTEKQFRASILTSHTTIPSADSILTFKFNRSSNQKILVFAFSNTTYWTSQTHLWGSYPTTGK